MTDILQSGLANRSEKRILQPRGFSPRVFLLVYTIFTLFLVGTLLYAQTSLATQNSGGAVDDEGKKEKKTGEKIWKTYRELLTKEGREKSQGEIEKLYQWKLNQGIRNHYYYAAALVRESQEAARKGETAAIPALLDYAEKMAPDFGEVTYARARWLWSKDFPSLPNIGGAIWLWGRGFSLSFYNLEEALPQLANLLLWILISFLLTTAIFS
jgi:hypothetical protein